MKRFLSIGFLLVASLIGWHDTAAGLGVSPTRFELTARPGEQVTQAIHVLNISQEPIHVNVSLLDFMQKGKEIRSVDPGTAPFSAASWIRFTPNQFDLSPNDRTYLRFTAIVPSQASGEYRTSLRLEELPQLRPETSGVVLGVRMNIPIYIRIQGTERPHCVITNVSLAHAPVDPVQKFDFPLLVKIKLKNDGNVHLRPAGMLTVQEKKTKKIAYQQALQNDEPVLPGGELVLTAGLKEWQTVLAGDYEAYVKLLYFERRRQVEARKTFKVLPSGAINQ